MVSATVCLGYGLNYGYGLGSPFHYGALLRKKKWVVAATAMVPENKSGRESAYTSLNSLARLVSGTAETGTSGTPALAYRPLGFPFLHEKRVAG
ncbi:hypothetical protein HPB50_019672 [Hyalomma asiaticum]|uniref:Uncharacterized protein n=1 Tax=Hyalomma asiaticum TaxID=266040 RepID=A0ACB7S7F0_HYAAI|nr:hypothetical protein HPB50_019672 [Hyalomma asiaticum]